MLSPLEENGLVLLAAGGTGAADGAGGGREIFPGKVALFCAAVAPFLAPPARGRCRGATDVLVGSIDWESTVERRHN